MTDKTLGRTGALEPVTLGGVKQWITCAGNPDGPVLFVLAGGPGGTEIGWFRRYAPALERDFLVVHWDQRGAGKSFSLLFRDRARMTSQQYVADGLELLDRLQARFGRQRVILLGHSWGSLLGVWLAQRSPARVAAYVGVGQMVKPAESDVLQYRWTLKRAREQGDSAVVRRLEKAGPPPYRGGTLTVARRYATITLANFRYMTTDIRTAGGTPAGGDLAAMTAVPGYRRIDKLGAVAGVALTFGRAYPQLEGVDLLTQVPRLDVPVYFAEGRHDWNAPTELVERYAATLQAPHVELVWFDRSGHSPCFEEPDRFTELLRRVVAEATTPTSPHPAGGS